tara:strand:+ start:1014 stop:1433 length:420 start_codon:yes stop_codon:yes gene_type:complete
MTLLCLNNINLIDISKISIYENNNNYKITYNYDNIIIYGILFNILGKIIINNNYYHIYIDTNSIQKLIDINDIFKRKIINFKSFLHIDDNNEYYISIHKNYTINKIISNYKNINELNLLKLNLKYINKENNNLIIYLIK